MIDPVSSGNAASGSLSYTSGYVVDDLIILQAYNTASNTVPSTPTGYTQLTSAQQSADGSAMAIFYKFATSTSETAPNPANSTSLSYVIMRGVDKTTPFSGTGGQASSGSSTSMSYSGIVSYSSPNDWTLTFGVAHGTTGNVGSHPPTNMILATEYKTGSDDNAIFYSNKPLASYSFNTQTLSAAQVTMTKTTELHAAGTAQTKSGTFSSTSSPTIAMGNTTTGDTMLVVIGTTSNVTVSSITDSQGNTYAKVDGVSVGSTPDDAELWYASNITGGTTPTITVTLSGSSSGVIIAREVKGALTLDKHVATTGSGASVSSGATAATTQAQEYVVGWGLQVGGGISAVGSGFSNFLAQATGATNIAIEDKAVTATGAQTATFTGGGTAYGAGVATFYISSGTTTTQTITGKARITASTNQTIAGLSRITETTQQTQSGKSRITETTQQTQTGKSRITAVTQQTMPGKANIKNNTLQTQQGKARITAVTQQTIAGKSRITETTAHTQAGKSRITAVTQQIQQGKSRITASTQQTQLGKSRITEITQKTITGLSRVTEKTTQNQQGKSRITESTTQTIPGKANIRAVTNQTQLGKARVTEKTTQMITGKASIGTATPQTIQGKSRITAITDQIIAGKARITEVSSQTQLGRSRITEITDQTMLGHSRISITTLKTIAGISRITERSQQVLQGISRITAATAQTITGIARIVQPHIDTGFIETQIRLNAINVLVALQSETQIILQSLNVPVSLQSEAVQVILSNQNIQV